MLGYTLLTPAHWRPLTFQMQPDVLTFHLGNRGSVNLFWAEGVHCLQFHVLCVSEIRQVLNERANVTAPFFTALQCFYLLKTRVNVISLNVQSSQASVQIIQPGLKLRERKPAMPLPRSHSPLKSSVVGLPLSCTVLGSQPSQSLVLGNLDQQTRVHQSQTSAASLLVGIPHTVNYSAGQAPSRVIYWCLLKHIRKSMWWGWVQTFGRGEVNPVLQAPLHRKDPPAGHMTHERTGPRLLRAKVIDLNQEILLTENLETNKQKTERNTICFK